MLYRESLFVLKIPTEYINVCVLCGQTVEFYTLMFFRPCIIV
jgi:hypothetical protein